MKTILNVCILALMSFGLNAGINTKKELNKMERVIKDYAIGADTRNIKLIESSFHDNFQVVASTKDGVRTIDKKTYISLISKGKIGGSKRELKIITSENDGLIGTAKLTLTGEKSVFYDYLTLLKVDGRWSIVSNVTSIQAR